MAAPVSNTHDDFIRLYAANQQEIYRHIYRYVLDPHDASDILQDTSVALFKKRGEYDPERPFLAWAKQFAYFEVLQFRKRSRKNAPVLDLDVLELIASESDLHPPSPGGERSDALKLCMQRLPEMGQEILRHKYEGGLSADQIAAQVGRTRLAVYRQLSRMRKFLYQCINERLAAGGAK